MINEELKTVDSTNEYIKRYIKKRENAVVRADVQTGGKGTKGRSFISEEGGLYASKLTFYENMDVNKAFSIMTGAACAVVKTLRAFDIQAKIKWPNDIFVDGKKICGILIENTFSKGLIDYSIVGIGLNVNNVMSGKVGMTATSMTEQTGKSYDVESVYMTLLANIAFGSTIADYKRFSCVIGKKLTVFRGDTAFKAVGADITDDGRLLLDSGELLSSAEIKVEIGD